MFLFHKNQIYSHGNVVFNRSNSFFLLSQPFGLQLLQGSASSLCEQFEPTEPQFVILAIFNILSSVRSFEYFLQLCLCWPSRSLAVVGVFSNNTCESKNLNRQTYYLIFLRLCWYFHQQQLGF